jgi:3-isopropylmalate/(R)-2-methylmalate dehydratase small subunit
MTGTTADTQRKFSARYVVLPTENVDTDQIIPARFLTTTDREGLGPNAFNDWRYLADGSPNPDFVLNKPESQGSEVLVAGHNFGCGSSREHAPWALAQYGFRVILAPSFADIFHGNCCQNGLLPAVLPTNAVEELFRRYETAPDGYELTVDLLTTTVRDARGFESAFDIPGYRRDMLLQGLDEIDRTLRHEAAIAAFERGRP